MAGRPRKSGLDYFELDCQLDEKVRLIQAEYGLKGFAVVVKLFQKIYGEAGYYCEWNEDSLLLFMSENGLSGDSKNLISEIIAACVRRNIFSEDLFKRYSILTSSGIQKRYLSAASKRESVEVKKEYLLIKVGEKYKNVVINSISDGRNTISDGRNTQSRVEKSRVEYFNKGAERQVFGNTEQVNSLPIELHEPVKEWMSYKAEKRQPYKGTSLKVLIEEILKYTRSYGAERVAAIIKESIANNYSGIIWGKLTVTAPVAKPKNAFHNFESRSDNMDDLEATLDRQFAENHRGTTDGNIR